jgi:lipopolysaccharide export system protein LptA
VRGYDKTRKHARRCAWCWLILFASAVSGPVRAQQGPEPELARRTRDPIDLAADQILSWQEGDVRWFLLSGQIAVLQGNEGLRARQAVVRVTGPDLPGMRAYHAEVYAEGDVSPVGPRGRPIPALRMTLRSNQDVRPKPYDEGALYRLPGPPASPPIILRRAFPPAAAVATAPTLTQARPAPSQPSSGAIARPQSERPFDAMLPQATSLPQALPSPVELPQQPSMGLPQAVATTPMVPGPSPAETNPITTLSPSDLPPLPANGQSPSSPPTVMATETGPDPSGEVVTVPPRPTISARPTKRDAPRTVARADGSGLTRGDADGRMVTPTQFESEAGLGGPNVANGGDLPPPAEAPGMSEPDEETAPTAPSPLDRGTVVPDLSPPAGRAGTTLEPLPGPDGRPLPPLNRETLPARDPKAPADVLPILPGTQRITRIFPRNGGPDFSYESLKTVDGVSIAVIRGGVEIVSEAPQFGIIDVSADSAIIWRRIDPQAGGGVMKGPNGEDIESAGAPMEVYLEGNVVFLQDERKVAGNGDQKTFRAKQAYYDFRTGRFVALKE